MERYRVAVTDYLAEATVERSVLGPIADVVLLQAVREDEIVERVNPGYYPAERATAPLESAPAGAPGAAPAAVLELDKHPTDSHPSPSPAEKE